MRGRLVLAIVAAGLLTILALIVERFYGGERTDSSLIASTPTLQLATPAPAIETPSPSPSPSLSPLPAGQAESPTPSLTPKSSPSTQPVSRAGAQATPGSTLPTSVKLAVPFTIQAPDSQWVEPWKEGCEEAALLMVKAYHDGRTESVLPVTEMKTAIAEMVEWQQTRFGGHFDLGLSDIAIIAKEYLGYKTVTVKSFQDFDDIRRELANNQPVIVPAAGRLLQNPYFTQPGPPYHAFVITGYEGTDFIVNENGTRQGRNYRYSQAILEQAIHDYEKGADITKTPARYLVLER